ncbi:aminotransferase-like domain-containing protein [Clostridium brassicae]|uniref:PLP-dependent aminotransferase family protein n=1 Tax=Clostridium brassicae TaxID=2999072 RepID=A0ABT4DD45_9CLOT|nr:PLP-dependent aminotransferase family protein [Clostridium brassicae]MCY6960237.1 PLP-dependent aminotransferase family protein [Clostridium brassicae]
MSVNSFENYPMSWKPKRPQTNKPLYLAIAEQLEQDIENGILLPGTKLPPQRELADYLDINVSTISRAFKICEQKGLVNGAVGSGTLVAYDTTVSSYLAPEYDVPRLIEMGSLFTESTSYEEVTMLLKKMIVEPDFGKLLQYSRPNGVLWQKEAAVKLIRNAGYETSAEHLLIASGGQNAIAAIMAGLFKPGDRIGTDPVTYPGVKTVAKMLGIQLVPIQQEHNEMSEAGLLYACKNENIKGIYIMPDYQNPTTHIISQLGRKMIANVAKQQNLIVIEDGIHSLLNERPQKAVASYAPEQTIYIASLSKTVAPGLRLAYVATPEKYKIALSNALYNINLSVSPFLVELASRMIVSKNAEKLIEMHRRLAKQRNQLVNQYLFEYSLFGSDECIFRWLLLPSGFTGEQFERLAYQAGVQVYAAERFAVGKAEPPSAVRLAVAATSSKEELETALKILKKLLSTS